MYYCLSKYYVPLWCRWLSGDNPNYLYFDKPNNTNLFAYCENNPVNGQDRNGKALLSFIAIVLLLAVLNALFSVIKDMLEEKPIYGKDLCCSICGGFVSGIFIYFTGPQVNLVSSLVSAAAESFVEELWDYCCETKEFSLVNIGMSLRNVAYDTMIYDSINFVLDKTMDFGAK